MLNAACTCMRMFGDTACLVLVLVLVLVMTDALHGRYQPPAPRAAAGARPSLGKQRPCNMTARAVPTPPARPPLCRVRLTANY